MMTHTHQTAPTQFVEANDIRFAYRRFGKSGGVPLVFHNHPNREVIMSRAIKFAKAWWKFIAIWRTTASSERSSLLCEVHPTNAQYISSEE
jgi:hypothetical protein